MPKVYCKHCYKYVRLGVGDGIYTCSNCGAGLAPFEEIEAHGSYKRFVQCMCMTYGLNTGKRKLKVKVQCPHDDPKLRKLHGGKLLNFFNEIAGLEKLPLKSAEKIANYLPKYYYP